MAHTARGQKIYTHTPEIKSLRFFFSSRSVSRASGLVFVFSSIFPDVNWTGLVTVFYNALGYSARCAHNGGVLKLLRERARAYIYVFFYVTAISELE